MPKTSKWRADHAKCQAAVDKLKADLTAEIERLEAENGRLRAVLHRIAHLDESDESERDAADIAFEAMAGLSPA